MNEEGQMFKIVIIGNSGSGKTNISTRYINNTFSEALKMTVGVEFMSKIVTVHNQNIKVAIWDTAGQEKYRSLGKVYYKGASGVMIVYDVTDPQSYLDVEPWMRLANENMNLNEVVMMVVGNKVDLESERKVPMERPLKQYRDKFDIDCWEVSAKTGYNVKQVFSEMVEKIYEINVSQKYDHNPPFDSIVGDSVIDPQSVIGGGRFTRAPQNNNHLDSRVSKNIPEVVIEEEDHIDLKKKNNNNTAGNQNKNKTVTGKNPPNKNQNVKLTDGGKKKKKEDGGCC